MDLFITEYVAIPTETLEINENGTTNVSGYKTIKVYINQGIHYVNDETVLDTLLADETNIGIVYCFIGTSDKYITNNLYISSNS